MAEQPYIHGDAYWSTPDLYYRTEQDPLGALPSRQSITRGAALIVLVVSTFFFSYLEGSDTRLSETMALVSQVVVALLGIYVLTLNVATGSKLVFPIEMVLCSLFLLWCLCVLPFSISMGLSGASIVTLTKLLLMALVVLNAVNGRHAYVWLLVGIVLAMLLMSVGATTGVARGAVILGKGRHRFLGTFGNANEAGILACLGVWAAFTLVLVTRSRVLKVILMGSIAWGIVIVGWTASKGALLGLASGALAAYWFVLRKSSGGRGGRIGWLILMATLFVGMGIYFATTFIGERMEGLIETIQTGSGDRSDAFRFRLMVNSLRLFVENPVLGVGYGCASISVSSSEMVRSPHNTILAIGSETGLFGWLMFFGAWLVVINRLRRIGKLAIPPADLRLAMSGWILFAMFGVWMFATELSHHKLFWVTFAALAGYLAWVERTWNEQREHALPLDGWSPEGLSGN